MEEKKPMEESKPKIDMAWIERKQMHIDLLTPSELERALEEKKEKQRLLLEEQRQTQLAREAVEKEYWDDIQKSCLDGDPEERFARALVRMINQGFLDKNPMMQASQKVQGVVQMLRLHNIQIKDGKEKPNLARFMQAQSLFVQDPFTHRAELVTTKRSMFPAVKPRQFQTESEVR